jgi:hypothetical protein
LKNSKHFLLIFLRQKLKQQEIPKGVDLIRHPRMKMRERSS